MRTWLRLFWYQFWRAHRKRGNPFKYTLAERLTMAKAMADAGVLIERGPPYRKQRWMGLFILGFTLAVTPASAQVSTTLQNASTASRTGATLNTSGMASAVLTVNCASCSGGTTINFQATQDGTHYAPILGTQISLGVHAASTQASGVAAWSFTVSGLSGLQATITGYSLGTVTVTGTAIPLAARPVNPLTTVNNAVPVYAQPGYAPCIASQSGVPGSAAVGLTNACALGFQAQQWALGTIPTGIYVSPSGNDGNSGTAASPYLTIQHAWDQATSGTPTAPQTIYALPGQYVGDVTESSATHNYTGLVCVIQYSCAQVPGTTSTNGTAIFIGLAAGLKGNFVYGMKVDGEAGPNAGNHVWGTGIQVGSYGAVLSSNWVQNIAQAAYTSYPNGGAGLASDNYYGATGVLFQNNYIYAVGADCNNAAQLIHGVYSESPGDRIVNNIIGSVLCGYGIVSFHGAMQLTIANNLVFQTFKGIEINNAGGAGSGGQTNLGLSNDYSSVFNNIVIDPPSANPNGHTVHGITEAAAQGPHNSFNNNITFEYNLAVATPPWSGNFGLPTFVNYNVGGWASGADFHLANGSWGLGGGVGSLVGHVAPAIDFDGRPRSFGAPTVGPYELVNSTDSNAQTVNPFMCAAPLNIILFYPNTIFQRSNNNYAACYGSYATIGTYEYAEFLWGTVGAAQDGVGIGVVGATAAASTSVAAGNYIGKDNLSASYNSDGFFRYNATASGGKPTWVTGDTVELAVDKVNCKMWLRVRHAGVTGQWNGNNATNNPSTNTGGTAINATVCSASLATVWGVGFRGVSGDSVTPNLNPSSWVDAAPSGFGPVPMAIR